MNGLFCRGCISRGSPSGWRCQGGHCALWVAALSLGARRAGLPHQPAPGRAFLLGTRGGLSGGDPAGRQSLAFLLPIPLVPAACQPRTRPPETRGGLSLPLLSPAGWGPGVSPPAHLHLCPSRARMACLVPATRPSVRHMLRHMFASLCLTNINPELPWLSEKRWLPQCGRTAGPLWVGSSEAAGLLCVGQRPAGWAPSLCSSP